MDVRNILSKNDKYMSMYIETRVFNAENIKKKESWKLRSNI